MSKNICLKKNSFLTKNRVKQKINFFMLNSYPYV